MNEANVWTGERRTCVRQAVLERRAFGPVLAVCLAALLLGACGGNDYREAPEVPWEEQVQLWEECMTDPLVSDLPDDEFFEHVRRTLKKYRARIKRQPNQYGSSAGFLRDENGEWTRDWTGIFIEVTEKVDQASLPPEDRLPDCLEGVPVQVLERPNTMTFGEWEE